jgi:hypothetical protein
MKKLISYVSIGLLLIFSNANTIFALTLTNTNVNNLQNIANNTNLEQTFLKDL